MPLSIYFHYPFCTNHCSYCDFYKCLINRDDEKRFFEAAGREISLAAKSLRLERAEVATIFIGGGTPSLSDLDLLESWLIKLRSIFDLSNLVEFSIECNPESITLEVLERFKALGVTRPTFGVQSFNLKALELLDRRHNPHQSQQAAYLATVLEFDSFGVDLIFGLPNQKTTDLSTDLGGIFSLDPPHVSFYQLTVEPGTKLNRLVDNGSIRLPDSDYNFALYKLGCEQMAARGYQRYEVSSFAKEEHECRHNKVYWEGGDYLALGPSGHSFIDGRRFFAVSNLRQYVEKINAGELPYREDDSNHEDRMTEAIMLGLRMTKGIDRSRFTARFGKSLEECINTREYNLMIESGHLIPDRGFLRLSDDGMFIADEIVRRLVK